MADDSSGRATPVVLITFADTRSVAAAAAFSHKLTGNYEGVRLFNTTSYSPAGRSEALDTPENGVRALYSLLKGAPYTPRTPPSSGPISFVNIPPDQKMQALVKAIDTAAKGEREPTPPAQPACAEPASDDVDDFMAQLDKLADDPEKLAVARAGMSPVQEASAFHETEDWLVPALSMRQVARERRQSAKDSARRLHFGGEEFSLQAKKQRNGGQVQAASAPRDAVASTALRGALAPAGGRVLDGNGDPPNNSAMEE